MFVVLFLDVITRFIFIFYWPQYYIVYVVAFTIFIFVDSNIHVFRTTLGRILIISFFRKNVWLYKIKLGFLTK